MGKKLARFQLVTLLLFILSYPIDYLKDTDLLNFLLCHFCRFLRIFAATLSQGDRFMWLRGNSNS